MKENVAATDRIVPVILSGGSGTRLWPLSRDSFPKQLWPLAGSRSMLQDAAGRATGADLAPPMVACNQDHRFLVAEQMREAGIPNATILLEPVPRNTAPAIAAAALIVAEKDPDAVMWVMPADAVIGNPAAMADALAAATAAARAGRIATFGTRPSRAETGYGYVQVGAPMGEAPGAHLVERFHEKPDAETAFRFAASGSHLWNSGMFVFRASVLLSEMGRLAPEVLAAARRAVEGRTRDLDFVRLDAEAFAASPDISIDHAIAERTDIAAVVPTEAGWSDLGSWDALWEHQGKDADGNALTGDVVVEGSRNCLVRSDGILTAVVGLEDVVVVVTQDAVLAVRKDRAQDVKRVVERLKKAKRPEAVAHNRMYRPWGFYERLILGDRFQVKRIVVAPGGRLSLQRHHHRAEHWVVVRGVAAVTRDHEEITVNENESVYLPLGCVHRMANPGRIPLELIEVQSGGYLGEDDIVRLEDNYGRA